MRSISRSIATILGVLLATSAAAQVHPTIERGLPAGRMLAAGTIDSVNGFNGSVTLAIPIGQRWQVGGGRLGWQLLATYNSNVWSFQKRTDGGTTYTQAHPNPRGNSGLGWLLTPGQLYAPYSQGNDSSLWRYVDPYGGEHFFYATLHEGETSYSSFAYTRDGSYLRLQDWPPSHRVVEYPDGTMHWFQLISSTWKHVGWSDSYVDGEGYFTNRTYIAYNTNQWDIWDDTGRHVYVNFRASAPGLGQVGSVVVPGVGTQTGTYTFAYTDVNLPRSCRDDDPQTSDTVAVSLLSSITSPDGSSYQFTTYNQGNDPDCSLPSLPGTIAYYQLPTGGRVAYTYGTYEFPYGCSGSWDPVLTWTAGVSERSLYDGATTPNLLGTWYYERPGEASTSTEVRTIVTTPRPVPTGERTGTDCTGNDTVCYYRIKGCKSTSDWSGWDHGLPYTTNTQHTGGAFTTNLSSRTYQGSYSTGTLKRSSYLVYERDKLPSTASDDWFNSNRRVAGQRTVYEDDSGKYADVRFLNFDGLDSYRVAITGGNFASGNERRTRANTNASRGTYKLDGANGLDTTSYAPLGYPSTYNPAGCDVSTTCDSPPHSYTAYPIGDPWILSTFTFTEAT